MSHDPSAPSGAATIRPPALLVAAVLAFTGCKEQKVAAQEPPPPEVLIADVLQRDVPLYVESVGQTLGSADIEVRARVPGFLESVAFREGTMVKKGELLYTIDARPFQASLQQATAQIGQAAAQHENARINLARVQPLVASGVLTPSQLDDAVAAERTAAAALRAAEAAAEQARIQLSYTRVSAPVDGLIGFTRVRVGSLVGPGAETLLNTVSQVHPIFVRFTISEADYLRLYHDVGEQERAAPGSSPANLRMTLADGSIYPRPGRVRAVDREVDPQTGSLQVEAEFPNPEGALRPGQYARVRALTEQRRGALLVPQSAVQELQGSSFVGVVTAGDTVDMRRVDLGPRVGPYWLVERGLQPGERVIREGLGKVKSGARVTPRPAPPLPEPVPADQGRPDEPR